MMRHMYRFIVPSTILILAGCATVDPGRVDTLEKRLEALENARKTVSQQTEKIEKEKNMGISPQQTLEIPDAPEKKDIQRALKNTGFYDGEIDEKMGPKTKKAIEAFQTANDLNVDGKVGPNTWDKLKTYYQPPTSEEPNDKK